MPTVAVLARTNFYLRPYEDLLSTAGIRYRLLGRSGFWQQSEIRNVLAYVHLAYASYDHALLTAIRSPFACTRFIRKKELISVLQDQQNKEKNTPNFGPTHTMLQLIGNYLPEDANQRRLLNDFLVFLNGIRQYGNRMAGIAVSGIVRELRALEYYEEEEVSTVDNSPIENIQELIRIAERFNSVPEFLTYVRKVTNAAKSRKGVALSTIHQSKGQEFDNVFLVGATEGVLPHERGELEEERRIFFVGASRAAKRLIITYAGRPSQFITPFIQKLNGFAEVV